MTHRWEQLDDASFAFESRTRPGLTYRVDVFAYEDGVLRATCECEAWLFSKPCWHGRTAVKVAELQSRARRLGAIREEILTGRVA